MTNQQTGIHEQIRVMRTLRGMKQDDLATRCGLSQFVISFIETARANPTEAQLAAIKQALNWPSEEAISAAFALLHGEAEPAPCGSAGPGE